METHGEDKFADTIWMMSDKAATSWLIIEPLYIDIARGRRVTTYQSDPLRGNTRRGALRIACT
eukprot:4830683-Prorocentrum_lima.AAC.1